MHAENLHYYTITLSNDQRVNLEHLHASTRGSRVCDRIKAVLLSSENWSTPMIAQALRLHETTIVGLRIASGSTCECSHSRMPGASLS